MGIFDSLKSTLGMSTIKKNSKGHVLGKKEDPPQTIKQPTGACYNQLAYSFSYCQVCCNGHCLYW